MKIGSATGYVHCICNDELDFNNAMLVFARAFGACVEQRDDSLGDKPKLPEMDPYYQQRLDYAKADLAKWQSLSPDNKRKFVKREIDKDARTYKGMASDDAAARKFLMDLLIKARKWEPPTKDHEELRKFAIDQIENSLPDPETWETKAEACLKADINELVNIREDALIRSVESCEKTLREAIERTNGRRQWLEELYDSLRVAR